MAHNENINITIPENSEANADLDSTETLIRTVNMAQQENEMEVDNTINRSINQSPNEQLTADINEDAPSETTKTALFASLASLRDHATIYNILDLMIPVSLTIQTSRQIDHLLELIASTDDIERLHSIIDTTVNVPPKDYEHAHFNWSDGAGEYNPILHATHFPSLTNTLQLPPVNNNGTPTPTHNGQPTYPIYAGMPGLHVSQPVPNQPYHAMHRPPFPSNSMPAFNPTAAPVQNFQSPVQPTSSSYASVTTNNQQPPPTIHQQQQPTPSEIDRKNRTQTIRYLRNRKVYSPTHVATLILANFPTLRTHDVFEAIRSDYKNSRTFYVTYKTQALYEHIAGNGYKLGDQHIPPEHSGTRMYIADPPYYMDKTSLTTLLQQYGTLTQADWTTDRENLRNGGFKFTIQLTRQLPETLTYCNDTMHLKYSDLPKICTYCDKPGHLERQCKRKQTDALPDKQAEAIEKQQSIEAAVRSLTQKITQDELTYEHNYATWTVEEEKLMKLHNDDTHPEIRDVQQKLRDIELQHQKTIEENEDTAADNLKNHETVTFQIEDNAIILTEMYRKDKRRQSRWPHGEERRQQQPNGEEQKYQEEIQRLILQNNELTSSTTNNARIIKAQNIDNEILKNACRTKEATLLEHLKTSTTVTQTNEQQTAELRQQLEQLHEELTEVHAHHEQNTKDEKKQTKLLRKQLKEQTEKIQHQEEKILMLDNYATDKQPPKLAGLKHQRPDDEDTSAVRIRKTQDPPDVTIPQKKRNDNLTPTGTTQDINKTDDPPAPPDEGDANVTDINDRFIPYETGEQHFNILTTHLFTPEHINNKLLLQAGIAQDRYSITINQTADELLLYNFTFDDTETTLEVLKQWDILEKTILYTNQTSV